MTKPFWALSILKVLYCQLNQAKVIIKTQVDHRWIHSCVYFILYICSASHYKIRPKPLSER